MRPARQNRHATQATLEVQVSSPDLSRDLENLFALCQRLSGVVLNYPFMAGKKYK